MPMTTTERTPTMSAIVRVDLGPYADELAGQPIVVNGHDVGHTSEQVTEAEIEPGWSIIVLGRGWGQTNPARFYAYREDVVEVRVARNEDAMLAVGGVMGGLYSLHVTHWRPAPPDEPPY
jgi:hypothetical protein